jgi:hypothetical protein
LQQASPAVQTSPLRTHETPDGLVVDAHAMNAVSWAQPSPL